MTALSLFFKLALGTALQSGVGQSLPPGPSEKVQIERYQIFTNFQGTSSFGGGPTRTFAAMIPFGELAVRISEGGRRRQFDLDFGFRQEDYWPQPSQSRSGSILVHAFQRLVAIDDDKGLLSSYESTEDAGAFESGPDWPYRIVLSRPIEGIRTTYAGRWKGGRFVQTIAVFSGKEPPRPTISNLSPRINERLWCEPIEPFIVDRAWVQKVLNKRKEEEPATYQVLGRSGPIQVLAVRLSERETVQFAGWTKELVRVDLENLNERIKSRRYAGTCWIDEDGLLHLAVIQSGGVLAIPDFVARHCPEVVGRERWPVFNFRRGLPPR